MLRSSKIQDHQCGTPVTADNLEAIDHVRENQTLLMWKIWNKCEGQFFYDVTNRTVFMSTVAT